ncbi:MAG: GNAT family N-acetyltransferase [Alphaproteobacteria bacterium]
MIAPAIRRARAADADAIAEVYVATWRSAYPGMLPDHVLVGMSAPRQASYWQGAITRSDQSVLVAEDEAGSIVGFAAAGPARPIVPRYRGEVFTLYVLQDHQGQGIGRSLLVGAFEALKGRGLAPVIVWVLAANPARFFYERLGGHRVAERIAPLGGAEHIEVAYAWP